RGVRNSRDGPARIPHRPQRPAVRIGWAHRELPDRLSVPLIDARRSKNGWAGMIPPRVFGCARSSRTRRRRSVMRIDKISCIAGMALGLMLMTGTSVMASVVMLQAGAPGESNVVFEIDQPKNPKQLTLKTERAGVAGSVLEVAIDGNQ